MASKQAEVDRLRARRSEFVHAAEDAPPPRPVLGPMAAGGRVAVFAEVKRQSPGAGPIAPDLDPLALSAEYEAGGAQAVSVLTDGPWFGGSLDDLRAVAAARRIPVLRKDFLLDEVQVWETRAAGADLALLIVRILEPSLLADLRAMIHDLGMTALVEVHDEADLDVALKARARLVGVNNRDLTAFRTDLRTTERLAPRVPDDVLVVSESGIRDADDVRRAAAAGADAVLVGEALVRSEDPREAVAEMAAVPKAIAGARAASSRAAEREGRRTLAKVCGVTTPRDAAAVAQAGADYMGTVLSPGFGRSVSPDRAAEVYAASPARRVGVFVDASPDRVVGLARDLSLDVVQLHGSEPREVAARIGGAGPWQVWKTFHATGDGSHAGSNGSREGGSAAADSLERGPSAGGPLTPDALTAAVAAYAGAVQGALVDAWSPSAPGGVGRAFAWQGVGAAVRRAAGAATFVAAGGMTPDNAAAAVDALAPDVLDASSGLESSPGVKDPAKINAFVTAVHHARRSPNGERSS